MAQVNQRNENNNIIYNMNSQTVTMPTNNEDKLEHSDNLNPEFSKSILSA